jgi:RNA polymerase sigma factor (sigma-70 family)
MRDVTAVALDERLFRAAANRGELMAWEMLYARHNAPLTGYSYKILRSGRCYDPPDHVLDVSQETWLRIVQAIRQCTESPVGWLYKIAKHSSLDHLEKCVGVVIRSEQWPESPVAQETLVSVQSRLHTHEEILLRRLALQEARSRLSVIENRVLQLRVIGFEYAQISKALNISTTAARKIFQRAKQKLAGRQYADRGGLEDVNMYRA